MAADFRIEATAGAEEGKVTPLAFRLPLGCVGINFLFARAIGATQEAHFISYCRLLPPREIGKSFSANGTIGRGGGDRTHRPISAVLCRKFCVLAAWCRSLRSPSIRCLRFRMRLALIDGPAILALFLRCKIGNDG